ncbi:MAG: metal-dependent hydrolase [Thermoguttaceae bacterium]|nr:metal-dependent hydrolase [Thermoguttaceae bacterium]
MATKLTWFGHSCWFIESDGTRLIIDPYMADSPTCMMRPEDVKVDYVLVTHGHSDHCSDAESIAKRCDAMLVGVFELTQWFAKRGVKKTLPMNIGGHVEYVWGSLRMVPAVHSSTMPDGSDGGIASGFVISFHDGHRIYHAGDTAFFGDMAYINRSGIDIALLPIGGRYTMGPYDALDALRLLKPRRAMPMHYGTWEMIHQDPQAWADHVHRQTDVEVSIIQPGEMFTLV